MLHHSNGNFYAGVNGNDTGGSYPDDPRTSFDESTLNPINPDETFINIKEGKYYGHPNPSIGNYISFAGNPTSGFDSDWEDPNYQVGTQPEEGYDESLFYNLLDDPTVSSGSLSPNGIAEYTANTDLKGAVLLSYFAGGNQQIAAIRLNPDGSVDEITTLMDELGGSLVLGNPLDIAVDSISGRIYIGSHDAASTAGALFVLRPTVVPEPSSLACVAFGCGMLMIIRRNRKPGATR